MQGRNWELEDAALLAAAYPYTFWKPSDVVIGMLKPGDLAKLIFLPLDGGDGHSSGQGASQGGERLWVKILSHTGEVFHGEVMGAVKGGKEVPITLAGVKKGMPVSFEPRHIIDTSLKDPVPDPTAKWEPHCLVTNRILEEGEKVGFFYREYSLNPDDSGWRFIAGSEDRAYMENPDNLRAVPLGVLLRHDDRMVGFLDTPAPCAYGFDRDIGLFVETPMPGEEG